MEIQLLQLLLLRKSHTNSIPYPFVELGWWQHSIPKHQSGKSTVTSVCIIHLYKTIQGVPFKLYTIYSIKLTYVCAVSHHRFTKKGYREKGTSFDLAVINV